MSSCYLHVDLDAFFASVEQLDHPEYRGKAVIVGGLPTDRRAVVSTCSYEARKYGVHSAMPTAKAYKLCPNGIYLRGRMERYHEKSKEVMKIFYDFSPDVRQMSVDEAFIDISGTEMLFGPPEELAKKLKQKILEETGLTVSVGVAYNKYIAKIASGINKPNGLCIVNEGEEENFMLSLPLSKLWGVGTKTQEKLKSFGFYSIKDIHNAPLQTLISLFGNCTGNFLYNAVRGKEVETFSDNVKSHSISAEETYSYDLTDIFTIETALLKLCYEVRFRLLDEGWHSRTLHVKIRYEDFTTVSVQSTYQRAFSSLDDMYEKICTLFKSKYEYGKGIRLLGVGAQNLEKGAHSQIQELFDFGEGKKRKIEEAVLNIQKKNPSSEIKKARQFIKKSFLLFFLVINLGFNNKIFSQDFSQSQQTSKETEFYVEGDWELSLKQNIKLYFQNNDSYIELPPLVFKQKAAMSVFFMYDKKWYFDAVFQDGFENNKFLVGYKNQFDNGIFTEIKAGNKDIFLTSDYDDKKTIFSNGENTTFGSVATIEKNLDENRKIKAETFLQFDNLETFSKTWHGNYLYSQNTIALNSYIPNKYFYIPLELDDIKIYIQDNDENFSQINSQEFLYYKASYQLEFKIPLQNKTAIIIKEKEVAETQLINFIKVMGNWFCQNSKISIKDFLSYLNIDADITNFDDLSQNHIQHFFTSINGETGLWIYNPWIFSAFENKNVFPVKISNLEDIELTSKTANIPVWINDISFSTNQDENLIVSYNFYSNPSESTTEKIVKSLFPLGNINPKIYLYPQSTNDIDLEISVKNYTLENSYNIGTKAEINSVVAYVNGVLTFCEYDKNSGMVSFIKKPTSQDTVQIFWKEFSTSQTPTLFSAAGFLVDFTPNFALKSFISYRFPILWEKTQSKDFQTFEETENQLQSNLQANLTLNYVKAFNKTNLSINNTAGIEYINYNLANKSYIYTSTNPEIDDKTYFQYDAIIQGQGNVSQIKNSNYEINASLKENQKSAELSFYLPKNSHKLYESQGFILETKISNQNILDLYNVYLEIGNLESDNENAKWKINSITTLENQGISQNFFNLYFPLSDIQKSKLNNAEKAKILFEKKDINQENTVFGTLTIKSIEYVNSGFIADSGVEIQNHNFMGTTSERISISKLEAKSQKNIKKYVKPLPTTNYEEIIFSVYIPENLEANSNQNEYSDIKLKIQLLELLSTGIYETAFSKTFSFEEISKNKWENLTIPLNKGKFSNPTLIQFTLENEGSEKNDIVFYLGKIYLNNSKSALVLSDFFDFSYNINDNFLINTQITSNYTPYNQNTYGNLVNDINLNLPYISVQNQIQSSYDFENTNPFSFEKVSHAFSTNKDILNCFSFSENYSFGIEVPSVSKDNSLSLDFSNISKFFPIRLENNTKITSQEVENQQNTFLFYKNSSSNQFSVNLKYTNYYGKFVLDFAQKSHNLQNKIINKNYFISYYNSLYYQILQNNFNPKQTDISTISKSFQEQNERKETISFVQNFAFHPALFCPNLIIKGENNFSQTSENPIIQNFEYEISLPIKIRKNDFSLSYKEIASTETKNLYNENQQFSMPENYSQDLENYFSNQTLFLLMLPTNNHGEKIQNLTTESEKISGTEKTQKTNFSWSRNIFSNIYDLFVPTRFSVDLSKTYKATKSNYIENYNFLGKLTFSAFNIFGKNSALEFFDWYNHEEIISNFSVNYLKENWIFNFNNGINIYFSDSNSITNFFEMKLQLDESFSIYDSIFWSRKGKTAYLLPIIKVFYQEFTPKSIERNDGLDFSIENDIKNVKNTLCINYDHKVSVFVTDYVSVNTLVSGNVLKTKQNNNSKMTIDFVITLSGKLVF